MVLLFVEVRWKAGQLYVGTRLYVDAVVRFCAEHYQALDRQRTRSAVRLASTSAMLVASLVAAMLVLDTFIVLVSLSMLVITVTTLVFQLYKWWLPEHNDPDRYGAPDEPCLPGVVLVPMRHEEAVAGHTLERLTTLNHPDYLVMPIVDHPDDPGTAQIAHAKARDHPHRVVVCPYPEATPYTTSRSR
jgi:hypothetical protein